ncbi:uncharacterized protein A4U43_C02F4290 [Asparagus officinalis]|uniref:Uncharacterized protein n=1 Tax=Asparagus officinalis TaxID=4686 RepID=A0A5P1FII3_ASPOF|nr:uncharacterized protein LOC109829382 [Asparagus officinalis]ONK77217.1 uncharacterized protein A4U43_C02F4290 [Asparagus officinalis]
MGNSSLRCCLACVLPCGALDLIRIVHINGQVEEYSRPVTAQEVLEANPNHVITKPSCSQGGAARKIMILSPGSELKRGSIYFLIPASALPEKKRKKSPAGKRSPKGDVEASTTTTAAVREVDDQDVDQSTKDESTPKEGKGRGHHRRRSGRIAVWKPHLESIHED